MRIREGLKVGDFFFNLITTRCNIVNIGYTLQPLEVLTGLAGNSKNEQNWQWNLAGWQKSCDPWIHLN